MTTKKSSGKRIIPGILILFVLGFLFMGYEYRDELKSMNSVEEIASGDTLPVYKMDVAGNFYMDKFLERGGVTSTNDLIAFLTGSMSRGFYTYQAEGARPGCSSFTATLENGDRIFARNFDMEVTNPIGRIYTNPTDGRHSAVSTSNLTYVGIGDDGVKSFADKMLMVAAAYVPMDGMNDQGLAISIHMSHQGPGSEIIPTDIHTDKNDATSTSLMRLILDNAATVEEAVDIAKNWDLHDDIGSSMHFFVADKSGNSAILEWVGETDKTDTDGTNRNLEVFYLGEENPYNQSEHFQVLTNFIVKPDYYEEDDTMNALDRFETVYTRLDQTDGRIKDKKEALDILKSVAEQSNNRDEYTVHSVVYNLTKNTTTFVAYENFDTIINQ